MKLNANRRGQMELLVSVLRVIIIVILVWLLNVQVGFFTNARVDTGAFQARLITERLLSGPSGVAVTNELTGEPVRGTLDPAKLTDQRLASAYNEGFAGDDFWAGTVTLYYAHPTQSAVAPKSASFNSQVLAGQTLAFAKAGLSGPGGGQYFSHTQPVRYATTEGFATGWVRVELVKRT